MTLLYTGGQKMSTYFFIFVRVFRNVLQYKCSVNVLYMLRYSMIESIAFALIMKKVQITLIAFGIVFSSVFSIYNLPWGGVEWEALSTAIRKLKLVAFKVPWIDKSVGSSVDIECVNCKTVIN